MSEDEKAVSEILGGKRDMESFNEDFELTTLLKRYLSDQTEENLKIVEDGIKNGSMISISTLAKVINDYASSKGNLDEEETKRIIHIQNIIKEKLTSEKTSVDSYNAELGAFESDTKKHL